jgi:hypothetical protein
MHMTISEEDDMNLRNSAISHVVYMFKDKSLADMDKGFWPKVHEIYRFLRTGNHAFQMAKPPYDTGAVYRRLDEHEAWRAERKAYMDKKRAEGFPVTSNAATIMGSDAEHDSWDDSGKRAGVDCYPVEYETPKNVQPGKPAGERYDVV